MHVMRTRPEDVARYSQNEADALWRALIVERDRRGYRKLSEASDHFQRLVGAVLARQAELVDQLRLF